MTTMDVIHNLRGRLNFLSVYNLFDTVAFNQMDVQRQQQKQWIHMKNFEADLLLLNAKLSKCESLAFLYESDKLDKLEQLLENVEVDELLEAVRFYRENLLQFEEGMSMDQS